VQLNALLHLGEEGRARAAFNLSDTMRRLVKAGVRHRHPDYDDELVRLAATRLALGDKLFCLVFPGVAVEP
jgi:hypothetical protein